MGINRITTPPGKPPSIRDLGVTVSELLGCLGSGMREEQITERYPGIERDDFVAVYQFAGLILAAHHASQRLPAIRTEVEAKLGPLATRKAQAPRSLEDTIIIAAGRAIVRAMKEGKNSTECEREGLQVAKKVAKKYGVTTGVSEFTKHQIKQKVKQRFHAASSGNSIPNQRSSTE